MITTIGCLSKNSNHFVTIFNVLRNLEPMLLKYIKEYTK